MPMLPILQTLTDQLTQAPALALASLFLAGVLTSLTPCIYPMIPITASVIAGTAGTDAPLARRVGLTGTYVAGLALLYADPDRAWSSADASVRVALTVLGPANEAPASPFGKKGDKGPSFKQRKKKR